MERLKSIFISHFYYFSTHRHFRVRQVLSSKTLLRKFGQLDLDNKYHDGVIIEIYCEFATTSISTCCSLQLMS